MICLGSFLGIKIAGLPGALLGRALRVMTSCWPGLGLQLSRLLRVYYNGGIWKKLLARLNLSLRENPGFGREIPLLDRGIPVKTVKATQ